MPPIFICTTGTSIAGGPMKDADEKVYRKKIASRLDDLRKQCSPQQFLQRASAESNSLLALKLSTEDAVVLFHTETPDGFICAEEISRLLTHDIGCAVSLSRIEGLQVTDATRFRRIGVQRLFQELDRLSSTAADRRIFLNATGGFKAVVPYLTLYGLVRHIPVVYLFEGSTSLITLPPVPFTFDYEAVGRAATALRILEEKTTMPREEFFRCIPGLEFHDRERFELFLEDLGDDAVMPSTLALLLLEHVRAETANIFLSANAQKTLDASSGSVREQFLFILARLSDPLWRASKRHIFKGTDLEVYKPGNTSERAASITRGHTVYVCELLQHDEYQRVLPAKRAAGYDLASFTQWVPPEEAAGLPSSEEELYLRIIRQAEDAEHLAQTALEENQRLTTERDAAQRARDEALHAAAEARAELERFKAALPRGLKALWHAFRSLFSSTR